MVPSLTRSHVLILPLVILFVILLEEIAAYYLRLAVDDVYLRTAFIMMLYGPGIALFAAVVSPRLKSTLVSFRVAVGAQEAASVLRSSSVVLMRSCSTRTCSLRPRARQLSFRVRL